MPKRSAATVPSEAETLRSIMDWLSAKRILCFRMNTGALVSEYRGRKRMIRFGTPGMADVLAFPMELDYVYQGQARYKAQPVLWIECKAPKGVQSEDQKSFEKLVKSYGHQYIVAKSIDDVERAI